MKIKYIGPKLEIYVMNVGTFKKEEGIEVNDNTAKDLLKRKDFEAVSYAKPKPKSKSEIKAEGGENK